MQGPIVDNELDQNWTLQGRIIPPSCSKGDGCILHLQTKLVSWANEHFHTARIPIESGAGVEFVSSLLMPVEDSLVRDSLEPKELEKAIEYLAMAKLSHPDDAIAFPTISGLTIVIHSEGIEALFGPSEKCRNCKSQQKNSAIIISNLPDVGTFDSLMKMVGDEKSH